MIAKLRIGWYATGIEFIKTRDAAKHPTNPQNKELYGPKVSGAQVEKSCAGLSVERM